MEASNLHDRTKSQAIRANIFQPNLPPRVRSEPQQESKRSHLHGLHHHHHKDHHRRHSRHAKELVQSAIQIQPPTSFGDLLKQASGRSKDNTPDESRRASVARSNVNVDATADERELHPSPPPPPKPVRQEDVEQERANVLARKVELRNSVQSLSDRSLRTSRKLDDTYYSILEKISIFRQTIGNLQELSDLTKELRDNFQSDTGEVVQETNSQLDGFANFDTQENQVADLEGRIKVGRAKAEQLTARLEEARKQVEARARSEAEWEARTSRRLRIFWAVFGTIVALSLIGILSQRLKAAKMTKKSDLGPTFESRSNLMDAPIPAEIKSAIIGPFSDRISRQVKSLSPTSTPIDDDKRMRIFDEL